MPRSGSLLSPLLIGRDDLLGVAERRLAEVAAGRGHLLLLAGEAGIGKSRLISALETKATSSGFRTAAGLVSPADRDVPAAALLDMARSMIRLPTWSDCGRSLLELSDATVIVHQPRRRQLVHQVVDVIDRHLDGPTLMVFDDLQWADNLSLEIITELARATRDRPLLLVGAYRTDELAPGAHLRAWRSRLLTQRMAEEARLARLTLDETALMTTLILATGLPAPRDVVTAVYERTDGVPLHIEELLGAIAEGERADSRAIRDARVPDTLEDVILQRVSGLSRDAQAVARSGAVIGRCFVPDVLAGIMNVPVESLDEPLRELIDEHVLDPPGVRGLLDFRHQLLRDALYRSLADGQRRRLHARAGEFGKVLEGASEVHASVHFERAGLKRQAFHSALQSARIAAGLSSHVEAFELFRRAVDNMSASHPAGDKAQILEAFAAEASAIEETGACERAAAEARRQYALAGDPVGAAAQLVVVAGVARRQARSSSARDALTRAALDEVAALPPGPRTEIVRAQLSIELAYNALEALDLATADAAIACAQAAGRDAGEEVLVLWTSSIEGMLHTIRGSVSEGLERTAAAALDARERGFEDASVTAYMDAAVMAARVMEYGRAAAWIDEGLRYAGAIEQSHAAHIMAATGALVAWADGRWDEAVGQGEHALADRGCERGAGMARWPLAYTAIGRGEVEVARGHLHAAEAFGRVSGAPDHILAAAWGLTELATLTGAHADAIARSEAALELAGRTSEWSRFVPFVVTGTRAYLGAGRPGDAERWLADAGMLLAGVERYAPALDHAAGLLGVSAGSTVQARASLERAVRGWDAFGRTWESLWARLDLAGCLMRAGRHIDAASLIGAVQVDAQRLRSRPLLDRVVELSRLNRGHGAEAPAWHPLTGREFEVARLIAGGLTNASIAVELSVAPKTVSAHVEHILAKLGASRRTEVATWVATTMAGIAGDERPDRRPPSRHPS